MKSKNILRGIAIAIIAIACIIIFPNVVNADVTYTRKIVGNNKSFELTFNGLTLTAGKQYQFALTTSAGVTAETIWHNIANTTATTAVVNLNAAESDIASLLKATDTGYVYIKATDSADGTYVLDKKEVDLKLPILDAISYSKAGNWYSINELYNTGSVQGSGIGQGNATVSKGTYYQFQKVTDRNFIAKYLEDKNDITKIAGLLPTYPTRGYAQSGYFSAQDYNNGLYILWIEQVGTGTDKTIHGAIIHDGKPTATTVDEYLGTTPTTSPSASPSPSPSPDGTWADISRMKVEVKNSAGSSQLDISGISVISGHSYATYITKNKMAKPSLSAAGIPTDNTSSLTSEGKDKIFISKHLELDGPTYLYIYEHYYEGNSTTKTGKFIVDAYEIQRPEIKLGSRIKCYFFGDGTASGLDGYTQIFLNTPHSDEVNRNIKIKIGKVTDINILRSIKNGETDCLAKLMDYAKKEDKIYEGTLPVGKSKEITSGLNLVDQEYYYVYMVAENEGKYYPVEDVSLYQGVVGETVGKNLFDYLSDEFKWNIGDDPAPTQKPDDTTMDGKLPQTGQTIITAIIVVIVSAVGVIFYIKAKEYKI